ncbi:MAG: hypothetical protein ACPG5B_04055 [Chitinophagales bacterium]
MMKKLIIILIALSGLQACSTDFDVTADWKEISIVYGLLDLSKDAQYIKINKAFLGDNVNAEEVALIADSVYHEVPVTAILKEVDESGNVSETISLELVDAESEGFDKEEGTFADSPFYLYKTEHNLNADYMYHLEIETNRGNIITAETPLIDELRILSPNENVDVNLVANSEKFTLRWKTNDIAAIYDLDMYILFEETLDINDVEETRLDSLKWDVFSNKTPTQIINNTIEEDIQVVELLNFIAGELNAPENLVMREFLSFSFVFHAGGEELKKFNEVTQAQIGIVSSQATPNYSNLEGSLGLFSTTYSQGIYDIFVNTQSYDKIACDPITSHLKFATHPSNVNFPNCF